ncbi:hypothetical protein [Halorubrum glutamatedens]|uniref:Uncharacterized protein n=2 Tax=Haloferacaceae TaxID=1644056 RepID=A0ABD5QRB8_9EURY|nr:hypothetical protein [Halobellus captivus]
MDIVDVNASDEALSDAAALERLAAHPAAAAIVAAVDSTAGDASTAQIDTGNTDHAGVTPDCREVCDFRTHATGVSGAVEGREVLVGNLDLFAEQGWTVTAAIQKQAREAREFGRLPDVIGFDGQTDGSSWSATTHGKGG